MRIEWPQGEKGPCPDCNVACSVCDRREVFAWRHLDALQFKTLLECPVQSVKCFEHLGIDEKSFLKGRSYVSILYGLDELRVLDLVKESTT